MPWFDDGSYTNPWDTPQQAAPAVPTPKPEMAVAPAPDMRGILGSVLAAYQPQPQPQPQPPAEGAMPGQQPQQPPQNHYGMGATGTFAADYKQPDWMRTAGADFMQDQNATNAFFAANPQYAKDWENITAGGKSAYSTDGTSLIKTDFGSMSPEAAAHYAKNPHELLAAEGFNQDPTLAFLNYHQGPGSIGITNPRTTNVSEYLTNNRWTPTGIQSSNNRLGYAGTAFGAGFPSYQAAGGTMGGGGVHSNKPLQTGGGSGGGSVGGGGSPGSSTSQASSSYSAGGQGASRQVDPRTETIEGRIQSLLGTDASGNYTNPLIQQAANSAMQQFAGRGLLNSSMATEAATQAAMSKAIEIAGPDAQTYFAQGRANQDVANVFERDARGYAQDDKKLAVDMDQFNRELQYRYDALKLDSDSQNDARALAQQYAVEMENIKTVNSAYDLYLRRITDIDGNASYDATTKTKMKNEAGKDFDLYARAKKISWEMNLGDRFTAAAAEDGKAPDAGGTGILAS